MRILTYLSKLEQDTIFVSAEHKVIMLRYYQTIDKALEMLEPTDDSFKLLEEILLVVMDYSNSFSEERDTYFYEWIRVIPTNMTYAVAGFIAGLKDTDNTEICNIYYSEVLRAASKCLESLNIVEPTNE
tara:strand:+ start:1577 stop:1963 length:387 start_codon:yes stop_codon:yes gene_type:complete